ARGWTGKAGLLLLCQPLQLLVDSEVSDFLVALRGLPDKPVLIVFDTLARCFVGGEENTARDMGRLIANVDRIRVETGATVLLVHHTGLKKQRARGHTALDGAADTIFLVAPAKQRQRVLTLRCVKQKDGGEFFPSSLALKCIPLATGGESCALES